MEGTLDSSLDEAGASICTTEEESGWTSYFEDFFLSQQREREAQKDNSSCFLDDDTSFCSPSLVSDAASIVPWKKDYVPNHLANESTVQIMPKKLSFKKARTKEIYQDDSLEDTASSPVNSPKVSSLKQKERNDGKIENHNEISLVPGDTFDISSRLQIKGTNPITIEGNYYTDEYSQLKNKGLCLVPLSMFLNSIG